MATAGTTPTTMTKTSLNCTFTLDCRDYSPLVPNMRFKQPTLPRCPNVTAARGDFYEASRIIRDARNGYRNTLCDRALGLKGRPLVRFLLRGARKMKAAGMYAEAYLERDIFWNLIRLLHRRDMGAPRLHSWQWWLNDRQIPLPGDAAYNLATRKAGAA